MIYLKPITILFLLIRIDLILHVTCVYHMHVYYYIIMKLQYDNEIKASDFVNTHIIHTCNFSVNYSMSCALCCLFCTLLAITMYFVILCQLFYAK